MRDYATEKAGEWRKRLLHTVAALLAFETLTGLSIAYLPFSVPNQVMVLVHTGAGLLLVAPYAWYQLRHWRRYRGIRMTHVKLTGYFAMIASRSPRICPAATFASRFCPATSLASGAVLSSTVFNNSRASVLVNGWLLQTSTVPFTGVSSRMV